jgi:hypothetical protein
VEALLRIEGRGLCNVTSAWVSGAQPPEFGFGGGTTGDAAAKIDIVTMIVARPEPPAPAAAAALRRPPSPLLEPLSALASWVAVAMGWVAVLRRLQPAGRGDYLLARVRLPAAALLQAQRAAAVGDRPWRVMVHLQSDFAVHSLPLDIRIGRADPTASRFGRGARLRHGFKDASLFLRQRSSELPWWRAGAQGKG